MVSIKHITYVFAASVLAWLFAFCKQTGQGAADLPFRNVRNEVEYVGMAVCNSCHADVHETFRHTGMGRSFDQATLQKTAATFGPQALVFDSLRNFYYRPFFRDSVMYVLEFRLDQDGDTLHRRLEKISYIVGSGQHTNSHIISQNGYIYQAPVTWYTQENRWDMAPGFRDNNSRFDRWLTDECITCHNHFPRQVPGSLHKFSDMPTGIECERCHGPGKLHVEEKLSGIVVDTSRLPDHSIVNPRHLPRDLQMDICQRCHLQGVAVLNEGKSFFDFKPGMNLGEVLDVYLPRFTDSHERFIMASQADRLRLSECFKNSPDLSCLTCHHPHHSVEATPARQYDDACLTCHSATACTAPAQERAAHSDHCIGCHMPKSGSSDIPHVRITDHLISKKTPKTTQATVQRQAFLGIQNLTSPNPSPLDMARGYLAMYDKYLASPVMLDSATYYLKKSKENKARTLPVQIHLLFLRQDWEGILAATKDVAAPYGKLNDGWTPYRVGEAFFNLGEFEKALLHFDLALETLPLHLDFLEKKGAALIALGRVGEAKSALEKVLEENPKRPVALLNLGYAYALTGNLSSAEPLYDQALQLDPDYDQALVNKAALLLHRNDLAGAKRLLERALAANPDNVQAQQGLLRIIGHW